MDMSDYTPRLKEKYNAEILPALMKKFEYHAGSFIKEDHPEYGYG
jgi:hypothetical protein